MSDSILQSFLDNRFIKTDDPEHLSRLRKASLEIENRLRKTRKQIIAYTLVALDPNIDDDDPTVLKVEALIRKKWPTFRNSVVNTKDSPIAYIQGVILEALNNLSQHDELAALIWHSGCRVISHYKLAGQDDVLKHFLKEIGKVVEDSSRLQWNVLDGVTIGSVDPIDLGLPNIDPGSVAKDGLKAHLLAASAQQSVGGENPQWPSHNDVAWPQFFPRKLRRGYRQK